MHQKAVHIWKEAQRYLVVIIGSFICGVGINLLLVPGQLLSSGISGIALLGHYMLGWPIGLQILLYNIPILFLSYRFLGKRYTADTIIGTVLFSLAIDATAFLQAYEAVRDVMLCAIFGGIVSGIGYGLIFKSGSNTGGMDVIGAIIKKYYSIDVGTVVFAINLVIVLASAWIFNLEIALFTMVSIYATAELTNRFAAGFNREKAIFIISDKSERIGESIMVHLHRGVTYLDARGGFLKEKKSVAYVIVSLTQVGMVKRIVNKDDPSAFMIVMDASEVMGRGFSQNTILYRFALRKAMIQEAREKHEVKNPEA
ncbi:YitT family protein [Selenomonas sp. TAMA-11512]|uniref:YitT family protein n=1 Tax=Selenomonas sp. TAMA-11512 TaxID=3095337 RepID=UPI00308CCB22|nr:YitT family protein [Selenomonas sp. TAMA-11512]